ncbi:hypothetical protein VTO42DRAFT_5230 [Malbranchea cinnamomea]
MGAGAFLEPLVVVVLLAGGAWINRETDVVRSYSRRNGAPYDDRDEEDGVFEDSRDADIQVPAVPSRAHSPSLINTPEERWRKRNIGCWRWRTQVETPNTAIFRNRPVSRLLHKFPFLVECWYWALVYWTYQLGRAFTAVTLKEETVDVARRHALQLIQLEQRLHIFWELNIQKFFLARPSILRWINWLYSFIHIPGTIAFLVWLYYYTITRHKRNQSWQLKSTFTGPATGPWLYQARRRTLAVCNLLAFVVFTLWPCMPPRLLSDESVEGPIGELARSYGFVDTVHSADGASSVWTSNRFCNQYAAMPSLHFGYSLMIGITIMTIPLEPEHNGSSKLPTWLSTRATPKRLPCARRLLCLAVGFLYPFSILVAIVATANHFILDAVAGAIVCGLGWWGNNILLNLLPLEDYFLYALRIHKPKPYTAAIPPVSQYRDSEDERLN